MLCSKRWKQKLVLLHFPSKCKHKLPNMQEKIIDPEKLLKEFV